MQTLKNTTSKQPQNKGVDFSKALALLMPRQNGTPAGFAALAESLKRGLK